MNQPSKEAWRNIARLFLKTSVPRIIKEKREAEAKANEKKSS
mgnify:CR=1 FL=1